MKEQIVIENQAKIKIREGKLSQKLPVFYNPVMKFNRDVSVLVLNSMEKKDLQIADLLAGSGVRGIRFLKELKKNKIKKIYFNDNKKNFIKTINVNLKLNRIKLTPKIKISNQEANLFLLKSEGFDYIDIDPFGSPNAFLNNAVMRLARGGILAVTATDTAALTGTYLGPCRRKYWAEPLRNELMHEMGLRILIRKVQLIGVQFDKALWPIFSYAKDHYYRVFFRNQKAKSGCDRIIKQHLYFHYCSRCLNRKVSFLNQESCSCGNSFLTAGPLWSGLLWDKTLVKEMKKQNYQRTIGDKESIKLLETIFQESKKNFVGFYELHKIAKVYKTKIPQTKDFLKRIKALPTHFSPTGFKTEKEIKEIISLIKVSFNLRALAITGCP